MLSLREKFVQIACHNTSDTTYLKTAEMSAAATSTLYSSVNFTVHGTHWQILFRPDAEDIAGHLSSTPFVFLGGTVIFSGLICLFVFRSANKAVKLSQQNKQLEKMLDQLEQQNVDLVQFATMALHDLQAPLHFIVNQAHVLTRTIHESPKSSTEPFFCSGFCEGAEYRLYFRLSRIRYRKRGRGRFWCIHE